MSFKPDDRVMIKPLGVKGTVLRPSIFGQLEMEQGRPGRYLVQEDVRFHPPLVWKEHELERLEP